MTGPHRSATAAAVLVTAAAVLLGACGSGGGSGHDQAAAPARPSAATSAAAPGSAPTEPADSAARAPRVPDAQLTPPGGGTFTARQKRYLSGRVPRGTDPVAVLEGGQEICDRLTRTARIDPGAAASAIITGDISRSGATAAVHALCPDLQPVLDAAARGFADGTFTVAAAPVPGRAVAPGGYRAPYPSPDCTWRVTGASGTTLSQGHGSAARMTVPAAASGVTSSGCYAWLASGGSR